MLIVGNVLQFWGDDWVMFLRLFPLKCVHEFFSRP